MTNEIILNSLVNVHLPCTQCDAIIAFELNPSIDCSHEHFLARMVYVGECPNCGQRNVVAVILKPHYAHYIHEYPAERIYTVDEMGLGKPTQIEVSL